MGTGLQDLPPELVYQIVEHIDKRHALLTISRQTCYMGSESIYNSLSSGEEERHSIDGYTPPLAKVVEGLQYAEPFAERPFGRELKLAFLANTKVLQHSFGTYICFRESSSDEKTLLRITSIFQHLASQSIVVFPSLTEMHLHCTGWSSITPPNRACAFSLARVSKPRDVAYWPFIFGLDELPPLPGTAIRAKGQTEGKPGEYKALEFAAGHVPTKVIHVPYKVPCIPSVCYGTLNVVSYSQLWSHPAWSVSETVDYLLSILRYAHPEVFDPDNEVVRDMPAKDREKREKTTWAFLWVGRFTKKEGKTYGTMMKMVECGLYEAVACMKGRIKFSVGEVGK
ncbi:hypothetical protein I350_00286 [Cryptococcus amylolentus CBS 6273]|uniref:Uncharacterized protein n=1 Tax=Cryptococcus amylolentus CBS 6273 TaxID=1296118 RepID=A0A1E3KEV9_9TREE|nr:hypothetical protein I350_00286 [Cryptococcus amylolentus CBS 6273]